MLNDFIGEKMRNSETKIIGRVLDVLYDASTRNLEFVVIDSYKRFDIWDYTTCTLLVSRRFKLTNDKSGKFYLIGGRDRKKKGSNEIVKDGYFTEQYEDDDEDDDDDGDEE